MSGNASLTKVLIEEWCRDEAPKAPVLLYAVESQNPFVVKNYGDTSMQYKHDLFELNQSLWIGDLATKANLVIPFDDGYLQSVKHKLLGQYQKQYLYHRSALPALVMNGLTSQLRV